MLGEFIFFLNQTEHTEFSIDAGFHCGFIPKDKVMLEFSIIFSLMLIVVSDAELLTEHQTELQ